MTTGFRISERRHSLAVIALASLALIFTLAWSSTTVSALDTDKYPESDLITVNVKNTEHLLTDIDGSKVSTLANGKPKILFFFNTTCPRCGAVEDNIKTYGLNTDEVDFIMSEACNGGVTKEEAEKFYKELGIEGTPKCYDSVNDCWDYLRACGYTDETTKKPVIMYISKDNVIKGYSWNYTNIYRNALDALGVKLEKEDHKWEDAGSSKHCVVCGLTEDKAVQKPVISTASKTFKASALRAKAQSFTLKTSGVKGAKSFVKTGGSSRVKINKLTGKVTVRKGTPKGTYRLKVKLVAASTIDYLEAKSLVKTVTIRVK